MSHVRSHTPNFRDHVTDVRAYRGLLAAACTKKFKLTLVIFSFVGRMPLERILMITTPPHQSRLVYAVRRNILSLSVWTCAIGLLTHPSQNYAQDYEAFEIHVRPVLITKCIQCHGDEKQEGGLRLTRREELLKGGESGPALMPGKPAESLIVEAIHYAGLEMPPEEPLSAKEIASIEDWIKDGAPWPAQTTLRKSTGFTDKDRDWWAIQPIRDPQVPTRADSDWCQNEIDQFIHETLVQSGLQPSPRAEDAVLLRRLHYAITGLPPRQEQPDRPIDFEQQIDLLLDDANYGVNQARYWLDLVRYADSDGYNADHVRPEAAKYRDYVVRSFNADKPYDQFVQEQLAGDEINPGDRDSLIATMYLRHWIYEWNQRDVEGQWAEILSDVTETTSDVFLGLSLKCARCHDHKFDPLLQKDYYQLLSFFAPLQPREEMPLASLEDRTRHFEQLQAWKDATREIRAELHSIESPVLLKNATREGFAKFVPEIKAMIRKQDEARSSYEQQIATMAARQYDLHPEKINDWLDEETKSRRDDLLERLAEFDHLQPQALPQLKFVASDVGSDAPPTYIPDVENHAAIIPGFPDIIDPTPATIPSLPKALQSTGRRTALARWITSPDNPLTARVIVNRVWAQHFGSGLVETVNEFGQLGKPPTHPELLDWLASRLIEDGWSLKKLHRRILNSATWQQTSSRELTPEIAQSDPSNRLYWRMNSRRLSAEEIVDSLQAASDELTPNKRGLYRPVRRNKPDPQLGLFDFPGRIRSQGQRHQTTTPSQALLLMNNTWTHDRARAMQRSLKNRTDEDLIRTAYHRLFFRPPDHSELGSAVAFIKHYTDVTPPTPPPNRTAEFLDGHRAIDLNPKNNPKVQINALPGLPDAEFTLQAVVQLRSLYPDASVRTIAAHWSGNQGQPGWALGVTSTKSAYQPRNLILQLVGRGKNGKITYEVVPSNLRVELNKPYLIAVSINLADPSEAGITFYLKDLSTTDMKEQTAQVAHEVVEGLQSDRPVEIGGRSGKHQWDGLIHRVALSKGLLSQEQLISSLMKIDTDGNSGGFLFDLRFDREDQLGQDASGNMLSTEVQFKGPMVYTPREKGRIALLHALMSSNETIYLD